MEKIFSYKTLLFFDQLQDSFFFFDQNYKTLLCAITVCWHLPQKKIEMAFCGLFVCNIVNIGLNKKKIFKGVSYGRTWENPAPQILRQKVRELPHWERRRISQGTRKVMGIGGY